MTDEYMEEPCSACGERRLMDAGPLGVNCVSEKCLKEARQMARSLHVSFVRSEIARLQAMLEDLEKTGAAKLRTGPGVPK